MASEAFSKANEAFVEEDYRKAVELYTEAINEESSKDEFFVNRAHAYIKLENYEDALADSLKAISLNPKNVKAYLRKGVANFHLKEFEAAQKDFGEGHALNESDDSFTTWLQKCEDKLKSNVHHTTETLSPNSSGTTSVSTAVPSQNPSASTSTPSIPMPSGPKTRYDWYQTETHVIVTIMLKNVKKEDLDVNIEEHMLSATVRLPSGSDFSLELDLAHSISPQHSKVNLLSSKIEIKMKKCEGIRWSSLEGDGTKSSVKQFSQEASAQADTVNKYPTSSHHTRDWDKLVADIKKEEKDEKPEGDAALNSLFQQIYADGSDEVKKAMNKSFMESGGTVLSTNWGEIAAKKVDVKPPDGMEYKNWEY